MTGRGAIAQGTHLRRLEQQPLALLPPILHARRRLRLAELLLEVGQALLGLVERRGVRLLRPEVVEERLLFIDLFLERVHRVQLSGDKSWARISMETRANCAKHLI